MRTTHHENHHVCTCAWAEEHNRQLYNFAASHISSYPDVLCYKVEEICQLPDS